MIFIEERKMSAAQILNLQVLYYSKIQQISSHFSKENDLPALKMTKMAIRGKSPILPLKYAFSFER